jgi:hypothetical protein
MRNERVKLTDDWFFIIDKYIHHLIYINNILNKMGKSSQNLILDQLKYNINCISEFIYLKSNT